MEKIDSIKAQAFIKDEVIKLCKLVYQEGIAQSYHMPSKALENSEKRRSDYNSEIIKRVQDYLLFDKQGDTFSYDQLSFHDYPIKEPVVNASDVWEKEKHDISYNDAYSLLSNSIVECINKNNLPSSPGMTMLLETIAKDLYDSWYMRYLGKH